MADDADECPHGLDPSWCTFCRQKAAGVVPGRRPRAPSSPAGAARPPRSPGTTRARVAPAARPPAGPGESLSRLRPVVFHATAYGAWPTIVEFGLLTARSILGPRPPEPRSLPVEVDLGEGRVATVRDQRAMSRASIGSHLAGIDLPGWLEMVDGRLFFFARQRELTTHLARVSETEGQDVLALNTGRLLRAAAGRVEVTTVAPATPQAWGSCPCRGPGTFVAIERYAGEPADVEELVVVGDLPSVTDLVTRVVRHHPDRTTEVLVA